LRHRGDKKVFWGQVARRRGVEIEISFGDRVNWERKVMKEY
jgi:hypothetical protein